MRCLRGLTDEVHHPAFAPQPNRLVKPTPTSSACWYPPCFALRCGLPRALGFMTYTPSRRPKVSDVIEIAVDDLVAYAHFTHKHPMYGALLRVLPERFSQRPVDFGWVTESDPQFECFFPLGAAVSRKIVVIAGTAPISPMRQVFPTFRSAVFSANGCGPWWLWDGSTEWKIGTLGPGMERMPIRGVINDSMLIERIKSGWRAEHDALDLPSQKSATSAD